MRVAVASVWCAVLAAAPGCNPDTLLTPGSSGPTIKSFTAMPSSLPVGGGTVTLAWVTSGADTVTVMPGSTSVPATGSLQVSVQANTHFTLLATSSGGTNGASADVSVAQPPTIVKGTVVDEAADPVAGAKVLTPDGGVLVTGADGQFEFTPLGQSYDVYVVDGSGASASVYLGLGRADPVLVLGGLAPLRRSGPISGSLDGGSGFPESSTLGARAVVQSPALGSVEMVVDGGTGAFGSPDGVSWFGPAQLPVTVVGAQRDVNFAYDWADASGYLEYTRAFGTATATLVDGQPLQIVVPLQSLDPTATQYIAPDVEAAVAQVPQGDVLCTGRVTELFVDGTEMTLATTAESADMRNYYYHPRLFTSSKSRFQLSDRSAQGDTVWSAPLVFTDTTPEALNTVTLYPPFSSGQVYRLALLDSNGRTRVVQVGGSQFDATSTLFALGWKGYGGGQAAACSVTASPDELASANAVRWDVHARDFAGGCAAPSAAVAIPPPP